MNRFYEKGLDRFSTGDIDWVNDTINAMIVGADYNPDTTVDEFLSDIAVAERLAFATITGRTVDGRGIMDGNDLTIPGVVSAKLGTYLVIYKDTGVVGTSPLIALIDDMQGIPISLSGQDIPIVWPDTVNKILSLADYS